MIRRLETLIIKHRLTRHRQAIQALAQRACYLKTHPCRNPTPIGVSKFGGDPDVPDGFVWPRRGTTPLHFIAQINMCDIPLSRKVKWPADGALLFFYAAEEQPMGYSRRERNASRIVYVPEGSIRKRARRAKPTRQEKPAENVVDLRELTLSFKRCWSMPCPDNPIVARVLATEREIWRYVLLYDDYYDLIGERHQFGGWPKAVQGGDIETECQFGYFGVLEGLGDVFELPAFARVWAAAATRWQLILQVRHDESFGVSWGDAGSLYFYSTAEARASLKFNETWTVLQGA